MSTYTAYSFDPIPEMYHAEVQAFCLDALTRGELVSIQLETFSRGDEDEDEIHLYGLYANSPEWVADYLDNGGQWGYCNPSNFQGASYVIQGGGTYDA